MTKEEFLKQTYPGSKPIKFTVVRPWHKSKSFMTKSVRTKVRKYIEANPSEYKQCFNNAYNLSCFDPRIKYVQGFIVANNLIIKHAWNLIGTTFFDTTPFHGKWKHDYIVHKIFTGTGITVEFDKTLMREFIGDQTSWDLERDIQADILTNSTWEAAE